MIRLQKQLPVIGLPDTFKYFYRAVEKDSNLQQCDSVTEQESDTQSDNKVTDGLPVMHMESVTSNTVSHDKWNIHNMSQKTKRSKTSISQRAPVEAVGLESSGLPNYVKSTKLCHSSQHSQMKWFQTLTV